MYNAYGEQVKEVNKDLETMGSESITIQLTKKQASNLKLTITFAYADSFPNEPFENALAFAENSCNLSYGK